MTSIEGKLAALERIYELYRRSIAAQQIACTEKCAQCCTTDVTLTTLEAYYFCQGLDSAARAQLAGRLEKISDIPRFRPAVTTNHLAEICASGTEPPEEEKAGVTARCPLLVEELCLHYEARPLHCRCMVSRRECSAQGCAEMDDYTLTLNSVFLQVIEHLDTPGCSGNLLDVLPLMLSAENRHQYENNILSCPQAGFAANRLLKILMVPPEHQHRIFPILKELHMIQI